MILIVLSVVGLCISFYGFSIEQRLKKNPDYKPMCDISDRASCTKPIKSAMGKLFGISNTIVGIFFYFVMALFAWIRWYQLVFMGAIGACLISLYLAYILFFRIKTFCLICIVTYAINGALLVVSGMTVL